MQTFRDLGKHLGLVPADLVNALAEIEAGRGRQEAFKQQNPMVLETLREVAVVQSVQASNAIEDITAPQKRIRDLALDKTTPQNRSEAEIAGYRRALEEIHTNAANIPFTENVLKQFHGWLYSFTNRPGGDYKKGENTVTEERPDRTKVVRFQPVASAETPSAMTELHERFDQAWHEGEYHRLLLLAAYIFDFLMIHPFQDGNGRMSRLSTSLLLYHADYEVGRFVSWEKLISDSRQTYYDALAKSTAGWHDGEHSLRPWISYFLGVLVASYEAFETRTVAATVRGSKSVAVRNFIRTNISDVFTVAEVRAAVPHIGDGQLGRVLRELKQAGVIERESLGRGAKWRRRTADF
ncbi:MAG: Fic family protein [Actinomycetota bacterium]|nr:Fic family protein [Actinomycetota bacterium]